MSKILLVSNYYSSYISAGTSKRTREIKKGLSKLGWRCKILTIKRNNLPISKEPDSSDIVGLKSLSERYPIPIFFKSKIFDLIKSSDVVHIIDHWSLLNIITVIFCIVSNTPYIYSPCGALKPIGKNIIIKKIYNLFFLNLISKNASYFFAITQKEIREIKDSTKSKLKTILFPNGIWKQSKSDLAHKKNYKVSNIKIPSKYILFVGRLSIVKGPDILLEAYLKSNIKKDFSLIFAGPDEDMQTKMIRYIEKFTFNQNIFFLGSVSQKERDILMKNAALTVIPSRNEAMSMVALETSLMGTPFLATKFCGLDDFEKNNSGYICNGDAKSITNELDKLLKDINSINEVGSNAQKYVLSFYSWESIIEKINYYLKKLINN